MDIACEIAGGVNRRDAHLESASDMMSIQHLREYVKDWRQDCESVDHLIRWKLCPQETAAKTLAEFSRPGAFRSGMF